MARRDRSSLLADAIRIYRVIRRQPRTLAELAAETGLHERSVRRIIDALREAGVEIRARRRGRDEDERAGPLEYRAGPIG